MIGFLMLYLNNKLLTSDRIITYFESNIDKLNSIPLENSKKPSALIDLKNKLKAIFFEEMDKNTSDEAVIQTLNQDKRFNSNYLKLKQVLHIIFSLNEADDKLRALEQLKAIETIDWDTSGANDAFEKINATYGYFNISPKEAVLFTELAVACRTMICLFEKNNRPDDTMAYDYAYKLMALFADSKQLSESTFDTLSQNTYKLISSRIDDKKHPFHNALLVKLSSLPHARLVGDKAGWRNFIKNYGINAFSYFMMSDKIEKEIKRAPKDLKEAEKIAMLCQYQRALEDIDFSELCRRYKVSDDRFNLCLDFMQSGWPKKLGDTIPDICVEGHGVAEGLFWVKLPVTDKRGLILGDITDCCQSIGGHSERCVVDAVTLSDNGLYVLVKQRKKGQPALVINGQINDQDFKIIGQSYVWKSVTGNLCLDSIECLGGEVSDQAIKQMLSEFGKQVVANYSDIHYVTIGTGGKTPEKLFEPSKMPEIIRQGFFYNDSMSQYTITEATITLNDAQRELLEHLGEVSSKRCIDYLKHYIVNADFQETLRQLFQTGPFAETNLALLKNHHQPERLIYAFIALQTLGLLASNPIQTNFEFFAKKSQDPLQLFEVLVTLNDAGLCTGDQAQRNIEFILENVFHEDPQKEFDQVPFENLFEFEEVPFENPFENFLEDPFLVPDLEDPFLVPGEEYVEEHDEEDVEEHDEEHDEEDVEDEFNADIELLSYERKQKLSDLTHVLVILGNGGLLAGEQGDLNRKVVATYPYFAKLTWILELLHKAGSLRGEKAQSNFNFVTTFQDINKLTLILDLLHKAGLLTGEQAKKNIDLVTNYPFLDTLQKGLLQLDEAHILTSEKAQLSFELMINFPLSTGGPGKVVQILIQLHNAGVLLDEYAEANCKLVFNDPWKIDRMAKLVILLHNAALLIGEHAEANRELLKTKQYISDVLEPLEKLHEAGLLTSEQAQANFELVVNYQPECFRLKMAEIMILLHNVGLLIGEHAEANRALLANHKDSYGLYKALVSLDRAGLLRGEKAQENFEAIAKVEIDQLESFTEHLISLSATPQKSHSYKTIFKQISEENNNEAYQSPKGSKK